MKHLKLLLLFTLLTAYAFGQETPPSGTKQLTTNQGYINPVDSAIWWRISATGVPSFYYQGVRMKELQDSLGLKQNRVSYDIKEKFGAQGDGVTDDTDAFQNAAIYLQTSVIKELYLPAGRYIVNAPIIFPAGTKISGTGRGSIIDASQADSASFPAPINQVRSSVITISGDEPTQIGITSVKPLFGDNSITLSSAISLDKDDILLLSDTSAYSYSLFRPEYKQGELVRVASNVISSTSIGLEGRIIATLYKNNPLVYKMSKSEAFVSGVSIIAPNDGLSEVTALRFEYITNGKIDNFYGSNSNYAIVSINDCANILIDKAFIDKSTPDISGTSYGIIIGDAEDITVTNSEMYSIKHALTTGGGGKYSIVTRRVKAYNSVFYSNGGIGAFDFHGNTEYSGVFNCKLDGGITLAGRRNSAQGNTIMQDVTGNESAIFFAEVIEPSFEISSNRVYAYKASPSGGMWLRLSAGVNTEFTGMVSIHDNVFSFVNKPGDTMFYSGVLIDYTGAGTNNIKASIKNNEFIINDNISNSTSAIVIGLNNLSYPYSNVEITGNSIFGGNIEASGIERATISNNTISNSLYHGINLTNSSGVIANNKTYNTNRANSGSSTTNSIIIASTNKKISIHDNFGGGGAFSTYGISVGGADTLVLDNNKHGVNLRQYYFDSVSQYEFDILPQEGSPNSVIAAKVGSVYIQENGSSGNVLWVKTSGTGNTGWDQVSTSSNTETLTNKTLSSSSLTGTTKISVVEYADNAAAIAGGLAVGAIYRTGDVLKIVH